MTQDDPFIQSIGELFDLDRHRIEAAVRVDGELLGAVSGVQLQAGDRHVWSSSKPAASNGTYVVTQVGQVESPFPPQANRKQRRATQFKHKR